MPALLPSLIDTPDVVETVRERIVEILTVEIAAQKAKAIEAGKDPRLWDVHVFMERQNPWELFLEAAQTKTRTIDYTPFVNVSFDQDAPEKSRSSTLSYQTTATFNIDIYAAGVSERVGNGHIPGDEAAALARDRAKRIVRNILMAEPYRTLGDPPTQFDKATGAPKYERVIADRWIRSTTALAIPADARSLVKIAVCRMAFEVAFREGVQIRPGVHLAGLHASLRGPSGEFTYFQADFSTTP